MPHLEISIVQNLYNPNTSLSWSWTGRSWHWWTYNPLNLYSHYITHDYIWHIQRVLVTCVREIWLIFRNSSACDLSSNALLLCPILVIRVYSYYSIWQTIDLVLVISPYDYWLNIQWSYDLHDTNTMALHSRVLTKRVFYITNYAFYTLGFLDW